MAPTLPILPPKRNAKKVAIGGHLVDFTAALIRYTCLFDHTGNPVVAMPSVILQNGIAASIQVIGRTNQDGDVLAFSEKLEEALKLDLDYKINQLHLDPKNDQ